jgi:hypothetical protein
MGEKDLTVLVVTRVTLLILNELLAQWVSQPTAKLLKTLHRHGTECAGVLVLCELEYISFYQCC